MEVSCDLKCGVVMCREDVTQHVEQDCVEKEIECPFAKYKCKVTSIKRKHLSQHLEEMETKHLGLKLNAMEDNILKQNEEVKQHINRMTQQINVLCSISKSTMLDWKIEDLSKFIQINHVPEPRNVSGRKTNIYFLKEFVSVESRYNYYDDFSANFLIRLYSTIKCRIVKVYDCGTATIDTKYCEKRRIARISKFDAQELSRKGFANKLILEMYITIQ